MDIKIISDEVQIRSPRAVVENNPDLARLLGLDAQSPDCAVRVIEYQYDQSPHFYETEDVSAPLEQLMPLIRQHLAFWTREGENEWADETRTDNLS